MAPKDIENQTALILDELFELSDGEAGATPRVFSGSGLVSDGGDGKTLFN